MKNQNNQLLKLWFLQATETLYHLSVTDIKKRFCNVWFFCINEACVNCGKENATTLTWLLWGIGFHVVVVFGLGKDFLFKSILGRCEGARGILKYFFLYHFVRILPQKLILFSLFQACHKWGIWKFSWKHPQQFKLHCNKPAVVK